MGTFKLCLRLYMQCHYVISKHVSPARKCLLMRTLHTMAQMPSCSVCLPAQSPFWCFHAQRTGKFAAVDVEQTLVSSSLTSIDEVYCCFYYLSLLCYPNTFIYLFIYFPAFRHSSGFLDVLLLPLIFSRPLQLFCTFLTMHPKLKVIP